MPPPPPARRRLRRRFLFYSHDALGLGHIRRNLAIASALTELAPEASVLVAASATEVDRLGVRDRVDVLKLPGVRKAEDGSYVARSLELDPREVRALRSSLLTAAVDSFRPDVLLVDKHPLGAGGELRSALALAGERGALAVLGLRDILDSPARVFAEWREHAILERVSELYERVLVYGHPSVFDPVREYGFTPAVAEMTRYCGYVVGGEARRAGADATPRALGARPLVLATAGGGEDGFGLLRATIQASTGAHWDTVVVGGPQCAPRELASLRTESSAAGIEFHTFVPRLGDGFTSASAVVCMGGYNTLAEVVASGVPSVCVPRTKPRSEQLIRARAFARLGLLTLLEPEALTVAGLRMRIGQALELPRRNGSTLLPTPLDGAYEAAANVLEVAAARPRSREALRVAG